MTTMRSAIVLTCMMVIALLASGGPGLAGSWPTFELGEGFEFAKSPGQVSLYRLEDKTVSEREALTLAKTFGLSAELEIDAFYTMPAASVPESRDKPTRDKDDEGSIVEPAPFDPVWPPKGAQRVVRKFLFKDFEAGKFLAINENNSLTTYTNTTYLSFASREGLKLKDEEVLEIVSSFFRTLGLSMPKSMERTSSEVLLNRAVAQDSGKAKVVESFPVMKELTFRTVLAEAGMGPGLPVVGGGQTIRTTVGANEQGQPGVGFYSSLKRELVKEPGPQDIISSQEAYAALQKNENIVNKTLRFVAEGPLEVMAVSLGYHSPTGYRSADQLIPVWIFQTRDQKNPDVEVRLYVDARKAFSECANADADLDISIPCASLAQSAYSFDLSYAGSTYAKEIPAQAEGFYWKLDMDSIATLNGCQTGSSLLDRDLNLSLNCMSYLDVFLACEMEYVGGMTSDPFGHYWRLDLESLKIAKEP